MRLLRHLPNAITCGNLLAGFAGIYITLVEQDLYAAVGCMLLAALLDVADGAIARALGAAQGIGKDLDSLADVISFGVLPAFMGLAILQSSALPSATFSGAWLVLPPAALVVCAALRLAKFNADPGQATFFKGLPTPAAALGLAGLDVQFATQDVAARHAGTAPAWVAGFLLATAALMVSRLPLISFKLPLHTTLRYWLAIVGVALASMPWAQGLCTLVGIGVYVLASQLYFKLAPAPSTTL